MDEDAHANPVPEIPEVPEHNMPKEPPSHNQFAPPNRQVGGQRNRTGLIVVTALLVLAVGAGAYWKFGRHKTAAHTAASTQSTTKKPVASNVAPKVETQEFNSSTFNVSFNYPKDWTVTDTGTPPLTVISPTTQLVAANGQTVSGKIIMTIQQTGQVPVAFGSANATAVVDSQKVSYTQPTPSQRAQTYLTFVQYAATTTSNALDGIYITGDFGYQKGQDIPKTDVAKPNPLVTVTFAKCSNTACSGTTALSIKASDWGDQTFQAPIKTLLTSLAFE
ncbi:MAG TPA: hypothetical protein VLG13_02970 [Patescibacteria group bacterium]|nr:hypothetical protein [Patescibacteria group bacterium]